MGRHKSDRSESPVKGHRSPRSRSPSYRQRSPVHRNSQREHLSAREKHYGRTKSPRQPRSRSPVSRSPVREKASTHTKSSSHARSKSPVPRFLIKEKPSSRTRSPKHPKSRSHVSRSPSPRTKRLGRLQAEREDQKVSERDYERNHGKATDRAAHRDKDSGQDLPIERKERRSQKDSVDNGSSRLRPERSISPADCHRRSRHIYRSPPAAANRTCDEVKRSRGAEHHNGDSDSIAKMKAAEEVLNTNEKQKPSFELSGKLAAETNRVRGVTLLFNEPAEARKPDVRWRLYVFKGGEVLNEPLYIHRQSCYLFGRERRVADIPTDHPSCSKQHAVLQYRQVEKEQLDGTSIKQVRPYLMDLGSTNGTFIHDNRIEPQRYYEIFEKDTIKFGNSSREYVLLHENSADDGH